MFAHWFRAFPGRPEQVAEARRFVAALLQGWGSVDDAVLVVSELAANAVNHTVSGAEGGRFLVSVNFSPDHVRIAVEDQGAPSIPRLKEASMRDEGGRGLVLVSAYAKDWGVEPSPHGTAVWADFVRDPS
ncbi:ATP-binding protein [Streptomyces sp. NPDC059256]|uniref:ATP-binding protein n=1 Tax=Streptomyces sp. NPDC059256 TaxID=3346794 RepID=UPI00367F87DF